MFDRVCIVHYHELGLKGNNRYLFERQLRDNLGVALKSFSGDDSISTGPVDRIPGRFSVDVYKGDIERIGQRLAQIPGVARVSLAYRGGRDLGEINKAAETALGEAFSALGAPEGKDGEQCARSRFPTFKVAARRANTDFPIDSMELNQLIGAHLCEHFPDHGVKMKDPDVTVKVEVIQGSTFVYTHVIKGVGGLPVGSGGKVISLLSSGIDSPVATWRMIRRGALAIGVHFSGRPQTADTSERLVKEIGDVLSRTAGLGRIYVVPFGDIQKDISLNCPPNLRILLYRRLMIAIAERIATIERAGALITGESLGQVASQTLANIRCVDEVATLPILRPLIGNDKQEIIADAERIETMEISSQDASDCCTLFMPRKPETNGNLREVVSAYNALPIDEMIERALGLLEWIDFPSPVYRAPKAYPRSR